MITKREWLKIILILTVFSGSIISCDNGENTIAEKLYPGRMVNVSVEVAPLSMSEVNDKGIEDVYVWKPEIVNNGRNGWQFEDELMACILLGTCDDINYLIYTYIVCTRGKKNSFVWKLDFKRQYCMKITYTHSVAGTIPKIEPIDNLITVNGSLVIPDEVAKYNYSIRYIPGEQQKRELDYRGWCLERKENILSGSYGIWVCSSYIDYPIDEHSNDLAIELKNWCLDCMNFRVQTKPGAIVTLECPVFSPIGDYYEDGRGFYKPLEDNALTLTADDDGVVLFYGYDYTFSLDPLHFKFTIQSKDNVIPVVYEKNMIVSNEYSYRFDFR